MTLSLQQRRRQQTAKDIQRATLELAVKHGLAHVTTEAIAEAAGISTRTFFNYYNNKEAAAIGTPPEFSETDKAALRDGTAHIADDLKVFLTAHIRSLANSQDILRMVRQVIRESVNARGVLDRLLMERCQDLADCLQDRVGDPANARALADNAVRCTARAIDLWEMHENVTLTEALETVWVDQIAASRLLAVEPG
ncbi:TetR/AcrR family transcriptional regulator [Rhodobacteraceae bacterium KMM 6894]|nr:TetR/AcrR family transcriptional regulator [Rhodobacteraceae bacterium KMM 6894]